MTVYLPVAPRSAWRFFPLGIILALLLVIAVNGAFVWYALSSFPGETDDHAFDTGNSYDTILAHAQAQAALGWQLGATMQGSRVTLRLRDAQGGPIEDAEISAVANRPLGPPETTVLHVERDGVGFAAALPAPGQWDVQIEVRRHGKLLQATRRLVAG